MEQVCATGGPRAATRPANPFNMALVTTWFLTIKREILIDQLDFVYLFSSLSRKNESDRDPFDFRFQRPNLLLMDFVAAGSNNTWLQHDIVM